MVTTFHTNCRFHATFLPGAHVLYSEAVLLEDGLPFGGTRIEEAEFGVGDQRQLLEHDVRFEDGVCL